MSRRSGATLVALAAVAASASVVAAATLLARSGPSPSVRIGEDIFNQGTGPSGRSIERSGGILGLTAGGCASCHGSNGHGLPSLVRAPDITYANLTDPRGMRLSDGSRGLSFTDQAIRRAVTAGIDPRGMTLSTAMPRWRLTAQEWAGLLAYLKTLK
jgi:mono/diheme cytochrome c family protein